MPNNGQYKWYIPWDERLISHKARIKVVATELEDTLFGPLSGEGISDKFLSINLPSFSLSIIQPKGGEVWAAGQIHTINWEANWCAVKIDVHFSTDDGKSWTKIIANEVNDGSYQWEIPSDIQPSQNCRIKLIAKAPGDVVKEGISEGFSCILPP